jgi:hypothetical protein
MLDIKRNSLMVKVNISAMPQAVDFEELLDFGFVQSRPLAPFFTVYSSGLGVVASATDTKTDTNFGIR